MLPFTLPEALPCLVAFSGGADSRLLLELTVRALLERDGEAGRGQVVAAHLHHGIRGEEADRDLVFCERVCAKLGVELILERADVPAIAEAAGESLETAARRVRYAFFERVMSRRGIPTLLTAHHADDNLETVLERLLRGSGTRGMGGIPPTRLMGGRNGYPPTVLYRPLLEWTKRDILTACAELGLHYITDSTNLATDCTRNRIRHTVIPALETIAGEDAPQRAATKLSRIAREDDGFLTAMAETRVEGSPAPHGEGASLAELGELHPAVSKRILMLLYRNALLAHTKGEGGDTLTAGHLETLLDFAGKGVPSSRLSLPAGMEAFIQGEWLYIRPAASEALPLLPDLPVPLTEGTTSLVSGFSVTVERSDTLLPPDKGEDVYASAVFPPDLPLPLLARRRREGDVILSHGMHKKLRKLLIDKGIPSPLRDRVPLICLPHGKPDGEPDGSPLWYPRAVYRDGYPAPEAGPCLRITVRFPLTRLPM